LLESYRNGQVVVEILIIPSVLVNSLKVLYGTAHDHKREMIMIEEVHNVETSR